MSGIIISIVPILLAFIWGYLLKRFRFFTSDDGSVLLRLVFYAGAPALAYVSIVEAELNATFAIFAVVPFVVALSTLLVFYILRRLILQTTPLPTFASMIIGAMIMNTGFLIPFIEEIYGAEGLSRFVILDAANAVVTFSLVYAIAVRSGSGTIRPGYIAQKLLTAPPLWAVLLALIVRFTGLETPEVILETAGILAKLVSPVILLALGIKFSPQLRSLPLLSLGIAGRFILGGVIGLVIVHLFGLTGLDAAIVLLAGLAPIGFNSITFSDLENLDSEFAATQVSVGILIGLVVIPVVIGLLAQ
ncbi:MAG: AEC family transporter [Patescibacteria group bacterium]